MALAILELLAVEEKDVQFKIDTGTNRYYQLKIGRSFQRKSGIDWIDEVFFSTPINTNDMGGDLLNSSKNISLPIKYFNQGNAYAQLFSFKTPQGKSPAFSHVIQVPVGFGISNGSLPELATSPSPSIVMNTVTSFQPPRKIPCQSYADMYSQQASLEELLAGIVKIATPVVLNLMGGAQNGGRQNTPTSLTGSTGNADQTNLIALLLNTILGSAQGVVGDTSRQQSLNGSDVHDNRFLDMQNAQFSRPFIFGIDDALLGALIGPVIQVLPQLMNAANQRRVQMKQTDNKLVTDILSEVNRRMLLEQLLQAQRQVPAGEQPGNAGELNQLIQLLQQMPAAQQQGATGTTPQPGAIPVTKSLTLEADYSFTLSSKALVSFVTANPAPWNGMQKVLFAKNQGLQLKIQLNVIDPVPKTPLPKAILKIIFKDSSNQMICYEKTFKQKDVLPNSVMAFPFSQDELSHLPVNKPIALFAEIRWLSSKADKEYKALGSSEIVLVNKYFLKEQGKAVSTEQELTDMRRFRPFWNKVWEAAPLDAASGKRDDEKKYLWELNVNAKYFILLSTEHEANGLMETKILRGQVDEQSLSEKTEGRMKAGIELSIGELNKLIPLWNGESTLDSDKLEAFKTDAFAKTNNSEFIYNFKLKGKAGERGMIWVIPIFKLFDFTLNTIQKMDEAGQVIAIGEEKVRFPLPVSARVIGLKSQ